jgi:hypothetical protein
MLRQLKKRRKKKKENKSLDKLGEKNVPLYYITIFFPAHKGE